MYSLLRIRNRWRLKLALRGIVVVVAGSLLALLASASGLEALRFSPVAIIALRVIVIAVFAALAVAWLWRPLKRQVSDNQVALYVAVLSSQSGEAFPLVIGEAMACGVPCAVTDVGDAARIVGELGRIAPPKDPIALGAGIRELLELAEDRGHMLLDRCFTDVQRFRDT